MTNEINDDNIRVAAYYIWEQAGCPEGKEKECWIKACEQLFEAGAKQACAKKTCATKSAPKKACATKAPTTKATTPVVKAKASSTKMSSPAVKTSAKVSCKSSSKSVKKVQA